MRFLVLALSFLLAACAITNINSNYAQTVSSWRWAKASELQKSWGRPNKLGTLPNGNRILVYHKEAYKNYPPPPVTSTFATVSVASGKTFIVVPSVNQNTTGPSYLLECTTTFEVDPRNIIVDVRVSGNNCTADGGFMISRSNPHPLGQPASQNGVIRP